MITLSAQTEDATTEATIVAAAMRSLALASATAAVVVAGRLSFTDTSFSLGIDNLLGGDSGNSYSISGKGWYYGGQAGQAIRRVHAA